MSKSQYGQDTYVSMITDGNKGIYVDIGAHDGISYSNTYMLEQNGWEGICIEPNPDVYKQLESNRKCKCISTCVYNKEGTVSFLSNNGRTEMLSGVCDAYDKEHLDRIKIEIAQYGGTSNIVTLPCNIISNLIPYETVDYMSIDVEGSELEVLQGIDFDKMKIDIIDIEINYPHTTRAQQIHHLLVSKGYILVKILHIDRIYVHKDSKYLNRALLLK